MTLKVYHAPPTRSIRVVWALEELGIPYELEKLPFDREFFKTPEWRAISPAGKIPVIHEDGEPMIESTAIIHYLSEKYAEGKLSRRPLDADYGKFLQWLHFGEAGIGLYATMLIAQTRVLPKEQRIGAMKEWATQECANVCGVVEKGLEGGDYILGEEFSIADISLGYILFLIHMSGESKAILGPRTKLYLDRLMAREAWKKAAA
jgi:glutathione S-transferase